MLLSESHFSEGVHHKMLKFCDVKTKKPPALAGGFWCLGAAGTIEVAAAPFAAQHSPAQAWQSLPAEALVP